MHDPLPVAVRADRERRVRYGGRPGNANPARRADGMVLRSAPAQAVARQMVAAAAAVKMLFSVSWMVTST